MYRKEESLKPEVECELTDAELLAVWGGQGGLGELGGLMGDSGGSVTGASGLGNSIGNVGGLGSALRLDSLGSLLGGM